MEARDRGIGEAELVAGCRAASLSSGKRARGRKVITSAQGEAYDLDAIFDALKSRVIAIKRTRGVIKMDSGG